MLRLMYLAATLNKDVKLDVSATPPERAPEMATIRGVEALLLGTAVGPSSPGSVPTPSSTTSTCRVAPAPQPVQQPRRRRHRASVRTVLIDGRVVLDEGRLTMLDERAVYERAEALARQQIARAGLSIKSKWPVIG